MSCQFFWEASRARYVCCGGFARLSLIEAICCFVAKRHTAAVPPGSFRSLGPFQLTMLLEMVNAPLNMLLAFFWIFCSLLTEAADLIEDDFRSGIQQSHRSAEGAVGVAKLSRSITRSLAYTAGSLGVACSVLSLALRAAESRRSHLTSVAYDRRVAALRQPMAFGYAATGVVALAALLSFGGGKLASHLSEQWSKQGTAFSKRARGKKREAYDFIPDGDDKLVSAYGRSSILRGSSTGGHVEKREELSLVISHGGGGLRRSVHGRGLDRTDASIGATEGREKETEWARFRRKKRKRTRFFRRDDGQAGMPVSE